MFVRIASRSVGAALVVFALGCESEGTGGPDLDTSFQVSPAFTGVLQGGTTQFTATLNGAPVNVTWASSDPAVATVDADGEVTTANDGFAAITATLVSDPSRQRSASLTVRPLTTLVSGEPLEDLEMDTVGGQLLFRVIVPAGTTNLTVTMSGGTGDADLYVRFNAVPNYDDYDCAPWLGGNDEECTFPSPTAGVWYVMIDAYDPFTGVTLVATLTP